MRRWRDEEADAERPVRRGIAQRGPAWHRWGAQAGKIGFHAAQVESNGPGTRPTEGTGAGSWEQA